MKAMKRINILLTIISILIILNYFWISITAPNYPKAVFCILLIIGFLGIYYIDIKTKYNVSEKTKLMYLSFLFFASVMGSLVNLYKYINMYDKVIHFTSGILASYIAFVIFKHFNKTKNFSVLYLVIFLISFNLAIATCWEIIEYTVDIVFNLDTQKVKLYGVDDTMQDIIAALFGGILFTFIYHKKKKLK